MLVIGRAKENFRGTGWGKRNYFQKVFEEKRRIREVKTREGCSRWQELQRSTSMHIITEQWGANMWAFNCCLRNTIYHTETDCLQESEYRNTNLLA